MQFDDVWRRSKDSFERVTVHKDHVSVRVEKDFDATKALRLHCDSIRIVLILTSPKDPAASFMG